jgi:hypothetical protein
MKSQLTPEHDAALLIQKFKDHVNPYIGSGMLSNTFDESAIFWQCQHCAIISINETIEKLSELIILGIDDTESISNERDYLISVRKHIKQLKYTNPNPAAMR